MLIYYATENLIDCKASHVMVRLRLVVSLVETTTIIGHRPPSVGRIIN